MTRAQRFSEATELPGDVVDALADVRPRLGRLASTVTYFPTIGSTNDVAATLPEGAVVIADAQTEGRGRRGKRLSKNLRRKSARLPFESRL